MRSILRRSTAAAAFLLLAGIAVAQNPDWYERRDERFRDEHWRAHLFAEVKEDLNHAQATTFSGRDEYRIVRTRQALDQLQADLAARRYNEPRLDEVIGTLQRVVADNRMAPRERVILNDDLARLREYRAHHENWLH